MVQSGTPRSIGALESEKAIKNAKTQLVWDVRDYYAFEPLQELTPMNTFVGNTEIIPGLEGDHFPLPRQTMM